MIYPTPQMLAWADAYAQWMEAAKAYDEARQECEYFPGELAQLELETALAVEDAYIAVLAADLDKDDGRLPIHLCCAELQAEFAAGGMA